MFAIFAAFYYWYPKFTGRLLSERIGKVHFWLAVFGFNGTFFVMHILGLLGLPRRVFTYLPLPYYGPLNLVATIGGYILVSSILLFAWNLVRSLRRGEPAGDNPWNAWTLEWAATSPPQPYNFEHVPRVRSRRPLWDLEHPEDPDWRREGENPEVAS
ncbi:MAG: cbb3-type cytochrome c oxidase subunit I [bacterium]